MKTSNTQIVKDWGMLLLSLFLFAMPCVMAQSTHYEPLALDTTLSVESRMLSFGLLRDDTIATNLCIDCPFVQGRRPVGSPDDPDYAIFGSRSVTIPLARHDISGYNFIEAEIYPSHPNTGVVNMNLSLDTDEPQSVGAHLWNLRPDRWNRVICQLTDYNRHDVHSLTLYTDLKGNSEPMSISDGNMTYYIRNVRLQYRSYEIKTIGWIPECGSIAYCHTGYMPQMRKRAIVAADCDDMPFTLTDGSGQTVYQGKVENEHTSIGDFGVCDFTSFSKTGTYRLHIGDIATDPFGISTTVYSPVVHKLLNYIFCQRCGYAVPGIHDACHADVFADHNGVSLPYNGGWHDAGDLSQQTLQTADVTYALLECYNKSHQADSLLAEQLLDEARWGLRFMLKTRFGDGYRASSMGLLHWTDGVVGTHDDIHTVRIQDNAFDNFLYAACEAFAAIVLPLAEEREEMRKAAESDYRFAIKRYHKHGVDVFPHMMEHTYNTSPSLFMAAASWSSSMLYELTGDTAYSGNARRFIKYVLQCQETDGKPVDGYFYRDTTRRAIVHFIHQSRSQLFAQALVALCQQQPNAAEKPLWDKAIARYAAYMKFIARYTEPYGMFPSGVYQEHEYADSIGFSRLHLFAPQNAQECYDTQLHQALSLGSGKYLRRFPIWFSIFNGNEAVILSSGKAAAIIAGYLHDDSLRQLAASQITWTLGQNPFAQSLAYGEGHDYPSMDSFSSGEIMGEIPVGIRSVEPTDPTPVPSKSVGTSDIPYLPTVNNACYKEVWVTSAGKLLSLIAQLQQ